MTLLRFTFPFGQRPLVQREIIKKTEIYSLVKHSLLYNNVSVISHFAQGKAPVVN